jgi:hypothetical protein
VSILGKEVAIYFVEATQPLRPGDLAIRDGHYVFLGEDVGAMSSEAFPRAVTLFPGGTTVDAQAANWCVQLTYSGGSRSVFRYSARDGLMQGLCPTAR